MDTDEEEDGDGVPLLCAVDLGGYVLPERLGNFETLFPNRAYINLGIREERRFETEYQFQKQSFAVQRFPAVRGWKVRRICGHKNGNKYGCGTSHRLLIRKAWLEGLDSIMIFEDDVVLAENFREMIERFPPPEDWGVLFMGCIHVRAPELVSPLWARLKDVWGMQAYVVRKKYYRLILRRISRKEKPGDSLDTDLAFSALADRIPMYAAYPTLAWQRSGYSDLDQRVRTRYDGMGRQIMDPKILRPTDTKMREILAEFGGRR